MSSRQPDGWLKCWKLTTGENVMAGMRWTNEWVNDAELPNKEFLFLIEK